MIRLFALTILALIAAPAQAERIKDLGTFQGVRSNQLTGYGVVVGLAGTGDDSLEYATQAMKGVAARFGLSLPPGVNPALKNAAAVIVTQLGGSLLFLTRRYCWLGPASWRASQCWRPSWPIRSGPSRDRTGGARPPPSSSMWPSSAVWPWRRCSSMAGAQPDDLPPEHRG